jgi:hypothetical protein
MAEEEYPNKIDSRNNVKGFIPSKLCGCEYTYTHSDDCKIFGCPSHKARLSYNSTSDIFHLDFGDGTDFYLDVTQMNIVND